MRLTLAFAASLIGIVGWLSLHNSAGAEETEHPMPCTVFSITDGDTFRCAETGPDGKQIRVRLSGVAARERDDSCTPGHPCPTASAEAATAELSRLAAGKLLTCRPVGQTYGRVAAFCQRQDGLDLSCAMVESGTAEKWHKYWGDHSCP
jgi:endonuclease YncB( thermonuclease family)